LLGRILSSANLAAVRDFSNAQDARDIGGSSPVMMERIIRG